MKSQTSKLVIFSGGTAMNSVLSDLTQQFQSNITFILPVSDNGGSSKEIIRVVGGPAIGDIRNRLIRLMSPTIDLKRLLEYRLTTDCQNEAYDEFVKIIQVDMSHSLWSSHNYDDFKHNQLKRSILIFLIYFFDQVKDKSFDFRGGSIGNFMFTGARLFFRSLETAIYWFSRLTCIRENLLVLPVLNIDNHIGLAAQLENGDMIYGQNEISHPSHPDRPSLVTKDHYDPFESPIKRLFYTNHLMNEIHPNISNSVHKALIETDCVIYGMGSFYTSILPSVMTIGTGYVLSSLNVPKIFVVNGTIDRETHGMKVLDILDKFIETLRLSFGNRLHTHLCMNNFITDIFYLNSKDSNGKSRNDCPELNDSDIEWLKNQQIRLHIIDTETSKDSNSLKYCSNSFVKNILQVIIDHNNSIDVI